MTCWTESKVFSLLYSVFHLYVVFLLFCAPNRLKLPEEAVFEISPSQVHMA